MERLRVLLVPLAIILATCCCLSYTIGRIGDISLPPVGVSHQPQPRLWPRKDPLPGVAGIDHVKPVFSFNGQIAYTGTDHNLWLLNGVDGARVRITHDGSRDGLTYKNPVWSPDGLKLLFMSSDTEGKSAVYLMNSGTGKFDLISSGWEISDRPWSNDSAKFVFSNFEGEGGLPPGIWTYDLKSGEKKLVFSADKTSGLYRPEWSPDGSMVSFREFCYDCAGRFTTLAFALPEIRYDWMISGAEQHLGGHSDWSTDGEWIALDQWEHQGGSGATGGLWKGTADGQRFSMIYLRDKQISVSPKWSPDGTRIAFGQVTITREGEVAQARADLMVIDSQGGGEQLLYRSRRAIWPQGWSKDGKKILFIECGAAAADSLKTHTADALKIYDFDRQDAFQIAVMEGSGDWLGASWTENAPADFYPSQPRPMAHETVKLAAPFYLDSETLVYLRPDRTLALHNLTRDENIKLPTAEKVQAFALAPTQDFIFYQDEQNRGHLLALDAHKDGNFRVQDIPLSGEPDALGVQAAALARSLAGEDSFALEFSPDGNEFAYRDRHQRVWLVHDDGREQQLPYASGTPSWSMDGRWMSYVTLDGRLYLAENDGLFNALERPSAKGQQHDIVQSGSLKWSSSHPILAYNVLSQDAQVTDPRSALVFDPARPIDESNPVRVMEHGGAWAWSPDGRVLAVENREPPDAAGEKLNYYLYKPLTQQYVHVGEYDLSSPAWRGWAASADRFVFGRNYVEFDLDHGFPRVMNTLLAASPDASTFLGTELEAFPPGANPFKVTFNCRKAHAGAAPGGGAPGEASSEWATLEIGPLKPSPLPALRGYLSRDGQWGAVIYQRDGAMRLYLAACSNYPYAEIPSEDWPVLTGRSPFSPNGHWLAGNVLEQGAWNIHIRSLNPDGIGARISLPSAAGAPFYWFGSP